MGNKYDEETLGEIGRRCDDRANYLAGNSLYHLLNKPKNALGKLVGQDQNLVKLEILVNFASAKTKKIAERLVFETDILGKMERAIC